MTLLLLSFSVLACQQGQPVIIVASAIPSSVGSLRVLAAVNGAMADEVVVPGLSGAQEFSFVLRLPGDVVGKLAFAIGGIDANDCMVAHGSQPELDVYAGDDMGAMKVRVPLEMLRTADCLRDQPRILAIDPPYVSTAGTDVAGNPVRLRIRGWGIDPRARLQTAGMPASEVLWVSPAEITARAPTMRDQRGSVMSTLINPDGHRAERSDLLTWFYGKIQFASFTYDGPADPLPLIVDDFDGNGTLDLAVVTADAVSIRLNRGNGEFADPVEGALMGMKASGLASGDLNGDARADLALIDLENNTLGVLLNQGGGVFPKNPTLYRIGMAPYAVLIGDMDADRLPDLLIGGADGAAIYPNLGKGVYSADLRTLLPDVHMTLPFTSMGDLNQDGRLDLVTIDGIENSSRMKVLLSQNSTFPGSAANYPVSPSPISGTAVADVNGDGRPDILLNHRSDGRIGVLLNQGGGAFPGDEQTYAFGGISESFDVSDFNGDAQPDLVGNLGYSLALSLLFNQGKGVFVPPLAVPLGFDNGQVIARDLNRDGRADLMVQKAHGLGVHVLLNTSE